MMTLFDSNTMFNRFRAAISQRFRNRPPQVISCYINGNIYTREGADVVRFNCQERRSVVCEADYVDPSGVDMRAIAYALMLIEGIMVLGVTRARDMPAAYSANNGPN